MNTTSDNNPKDRSALPQPRMGLLCWAIVDLLAPMPADNKS